MHYEPPKEDNLSTKDITAEFILPPKIFGGSIVQLSEITNLIILTYSNHACMCAYMDNISSPVMVLYIGLTVHICITTHHSVNCECHGHKGRENTF